MTIPATTKQQAPTWVRQVDQNLLYKAICGLFEMGARFKRTTNGFDVVYPRYENCNGERYESVLRSDVQGSLRLLIRFGLVSRR